MQEGVPFGQYQTDSQLESVVRWKINDAMRMRGQVGMDETMAQTISRKITDVILRDYRTLTDKEFDLLLEAGIAGELGKETWVSGAAVLQWLRLYTRHAARLNIIDEQADEDKKRSRRTQAEVDAMNEKACNEKLKAATEYCRQNGTIFGQGAGTEAAFHLPQYAAVVYDWFRQREVIPEPSENSITEAVVFAEEQTSKQRIQRTITREITRDDWYKAYLLEKYIKSTL